MYKPKLPQHEQGFTLVEVLVAILITTVFVAVGMQAVVIAAVFKARAEQYSKATNWIQENLETVRFQASIYPQDDAKCNPASPANGYAAGLVTAIGGSPLISPPQRLGGKNFTMTRTANYATSNDPNKVLELEYEIVPDGGGSAIASLHSEVIPNAAFTCPAQ